jgi:DNA-binding CsgD family transcriptional regulator
VAAIVGRDRELALAGRFLEHAQQRAAALVLLGEPGIGKTTVWEEVARRASAQNFRVLAARPAEAEARLALSAVADLFARVSQEALEALPPPQRRALDVALMRADPGELPLDRRALGMAVHSLLAGYAADRPTLIALDDVHWLDRASAAVLEFAVRRLADEPVGLLIARRHGAPDPLGVERLVPPDALKRAEVGPLSLAGLHRMLAERLEQPLPRSALVRVEQLSNGNPLFALEAGRLLAERGVPPVGEPLPVPPDVVALVRRRVARLPPRTQEVLLASASLADPAVSRLATALGRAVEADLEPAESEQLVTCRSGRVSFVHPLYAAAVISSAAAAERRRVHRLLAAAVDVLEERARHLVLATEHRDEEAAGLAQAAARDALFRGAPVAAAELVELALRVGEPESASQRRRTLELVEYLYAAGDVVRAGEVLAAIGSWDAWEPALQAEALSWLGAALNHIEQPATATTRLEETLADVLAAEPRAAAHAALAHATAAFDVGRAALHVDEALALLEPLGDDAHPGIHAEALYMRLRTGVLLGTGLDREIVDRIEGLERRLPPESRFRHISGAVAYWFKHVDDLETSRAWLQRKLDRANETGGYLEQVAAHAHLAITECWAGNLELAREHALTAVRLAQELERAAVGGQELAALALVEAHLGDVEAVRSLADRLGESSGTRYSIRRHAVLGFMELSLGDHEAADDHLRAGLEAEERFGCLEPAVNRMHGDAAETAVALGDLRRADVLADVLAEHGGRTGRRWSLATAARVRALVAAARGEIAQALVHAEQALEQHDGLEMPFERARTLVVKGVLERRARRRRAAKESLEEALAAFEAMGARLWIERARSELARLGLRHKPPDELTESELRVAELAAAGLTNRAVARAAFMSPKTVEANLARVYRKLGIRSRAELGARMRERDVKT